jgi:hypothetical protein
MAIPCSAAAMREKERSKRRRVMKRAVNCIKKSPEIK